MTLALLFKCYDRGIYWLSPREQEDAKRQIYILEYKRVRATGQRNDWISRWTVCHLLSFISFGYTLPSTQLCPLASLILHVLPLPLYCKTTTKLVSLWNQLYCIHSSLVPPEFAEPFNFASSLYSTDCLVQQRSEIHLKHLFIA